MKMTTSTKKSADRISIITPNTNTTTGIDIMTTIADIYADINPLPAMLSEKGKARPSVEFTIEANAKLCIALKWKKPYCNNEWEHEYEWFSGEDFDKILSD